MNGNYSNIICLEDITMKDKTELKDLSHFEIVSRFNPHDRCTFSYVSYEDAERFYAAYRALGRIIDSPENEFKTKLQPGRMVLFDNWRLLHGRAVFTGKRVMVGCYFTYDDLQQQKRTKANLNV